MFNPDELVSSLGPLTEEEQYTVQQFWNGRALAALIGMPGWKVIEETFEKKKQDARDELMRINPGDKDLVLANHAVAFAVEQTLDNLKLEIYRAIEASKETPAVLNRLR